MTTQTTLSLGGNLGARQRPGPVRAEPSGGWPVTVAVLATDPMTGAGGAACLGARPGIRLIPAAQAHLANVVLILADPADDEVLARMRQVARRAGRADRRFVLVADNVEASLLGRAARCGLVSVLSREGCDYERIASTIRGMRQGRVEMPGTTFRSLAAWTVPAAPGPDGDRASRAELAERERDVLRLLAEGLGTAEIAVRLSYSERTVKNIIHRLLARMKLSNRTHAVAFALGNGWL